MPPTTLFRFYWHYTRQLWPVLAALMAVGFVVALIEVSIFRYIASIVDLLKSTSPERVLSDYGWTFAWMAFVVVVARPVATIAHDLLVQQALAPSFTNLVRWQTHHYVLRQSVGFFTNDFAGRIASKIIQTGPALRESTVQVCDALWYICMYSVSALVLFAQLDWWLTLPLIAWIAAFITIVVTFVPRIRRRSTIVSEARSMLTGRIVDSYTNIQTVKLFAHTTREDDYARDAVADHTRKFRNSTRLITTMSATVVTLNGLLIAGVGALSVLLWATSGLTLGATMSAPSRRAWRRSRGRRSSSTAPARPSSTCPRARSALRTSPSTTGGRAASSRTST
jgi:ATP-binding cassette subfamily B multidrug efflux pump